MISRVQIEKIESMLKDGWTTVGRKPSDTNRTLGGPTLLSRNGEYVWVGADGVFVLSGSPPAYLIDCGAITNRPLQRNGLWLLPGAHLRHP
jgi:hypothetical protein